MSLAPAAPSPPPPPRAPSSLPKSVPPPSPGPATHKQTVQQSMDGDWGVITSSFPLLPSNPLFHPSIHRGRTLRSAAAAPQGWLLSAAAHALLLGWLLGLRRRLLCCCLLLGLSARLRLGLQVAPPDLSRTECSRPTIRNWGERARLSIKALRGEKGGHSPTSCTMQCSSRCVSTSSLGTCSDSVLHHPPAAAAANTRRRRQLGLSEGMAVSSASGPHR